MPAPIFSRRHYVAVAGLVRAAGYLEARDRGQLICDLSELFATDNERFQAERFEAACEPAEAMTALERARQAWAATAMQMELGA
jgi:hypothetical protein